MAGFVLPHLGLWRGCAAQNFGMDTWSWYAALLLSGLAVAAAARAEAGVSQDVRQLAQRVRDTADHDQRPFAIVDKRAALLAVFDADGRLAGSTAALLGSSYGDSSVDGVGERAQRGALQPGDATTPAGRFVSQPGHNHTGEAVVWVDLESAFAIHRLRPGPARAARARRLASTHPEQKRVSQGCVVVSVAFFTHVVLPLLGRQPSVVYVLPENGLDTSRHGGLAKGS
jgi:hypothetical protein